MGVALTTVELLFIRQTGNYLVAEDAEGKERWFDVRKIEDHRIEGEDLTVTLNASEWKRRVDNKEVQVRQVKTVRRICICCKAPHDMEPQNRICDPCKSTTDWRAGRSPYAL